MPYGRFPELVRDERNMMCVCNDCHRKIHNNPYYNIRLQEEKGKEIGIDIKEVYYGNKEIRESNSHL
ncbi:MAG: hypothetical protein IJZ45_05155 [Bacteroidaceae bacterium]|nr:hypothetical protein [Bacteroidaceae bacterium]